MGDAIVVQAEAALRQAEINLGYCTIKSPVKGVIIDRRVNIGQTVVSSLNAPSLFLIAKDLTPMQVWASVNEADIGRIRPGQPARFTVDAFPGEDVPRPGRPDPPQRHHDAERRHLHGRGHHRQPRRQLLPYLTANLQFEIDQRHGVLLVPNAALRWQPRREQIAPDGRVRPSTTAPPRMPERGPMAWSGSWSSASRGRSPYSRA